MKFESLTQLRGTLSRKLNLTISLLGALFFLSIWTIITELEMVPKSLFPSPLAVLSSFEELHFEDALVRNMFFSIKINIYGYIKAILFAIPLGFLIGLIPFCRSLVSKYIDALRFVPLAATTGLFIAWFGIEETMKVNFLAFSIFVYLLPVVIQRIDETQEVYLQTAYTMGASKWQIVKTVFIPDVLSRVWDDVRVLTAISWTYITIAEALNMSSGGIGALAYKMARQSRIDKVFAILLVIVLIGFTQDYLIRKIDKILFKFKYAGAIK